MLGVLAVTFTVGITGPFAFLAGRKAVAEIDENPEQFGGRLLARSARSSASSGPSGSSRGWPSA